jgi:hypothetical protein
MKNKELFYLALAIGGAFLIHKYFMKSNSNAIKAPVEPNNPLLMDKVDINLAKLQQPLLADVHYQAQQLSEYTPDTYQTYYGKNVSNSGIQSIGGGMPMTC